MKFSKMFEQLSSTRHSIEGRNLGRQDNVRFNHLYMMDGFTPEQREAAVNFEERFQVMWDKAEESSVNPLVTEKWIIPEGTISHNCIFNMDQLRSISQSGVLATEWFGIPESELEGRCCAFVDESLSTRCLISPTRVTPTVYRTGAVIYFDKDNELMQDLLSVDFFEYMARKGRGEDLSSYPPVIREFYDQVVEPYSPAGKKMHDRPGSRTYSWRAIPGGIPAKLINGISIHSSVATPEVVAELNQLFPNATIYNEIMETLSPALVQQRNHSSGSGDIKD